MKNLKTIEQAVDFLASNCEKEIIIKNGIMKISDKHNPELCRFCSKQKKQLLTSQTKNLKH